MEEQFPEVCRAKNKIKNASLSVSHQFRKFTSSRSLTFFLGALRGLAFPPARPDMIDLYDVESGGDQKMKKMGMPMCFIYSEKKVFRRGGFEAHFALIFGSHCFHAEKRKKKETRACPFPAYSSTNLSSSYNLITRNVCGAGIDIILGLGRRNHIPLEPAHRLIAVLIQAECHPSPVPRPRQQPPQRRQSLS